MGKREQQKGRRAEIELSRILDGYGYATRPGQAVSFGGEPDVVGLDGVHIEIKRRESPDLSAALRQATEDAAYFGDGLPVVFFRGNRQKWRFFVISTLFLHAFITTLFAFCRLPLSESERAQKIAKTRKRKLPIFHFSASQNPVKTHSRPTPDFLAEITLWTGQDTAGG